MKLRIAFASLLLLVLVAAVTLGQARKSLSNDDVVQMVKSGFDEATIIKAIQANEPNFDTSVDALIALKNAGVSNPIIDAVLEAEHTKKTPAPAAAPAIATGPDTGSVPQPSVVSPAAESTRLMLKEGTEVKLKFRDSLSSKTANEGDAVNLLLSEDLKVGEITLVKAGAIALGTISHAKKSGMLGRAGELNMRLEYLRAGDSKVRLRGTKGSEGQGKEGTMVALTVLFGPIGLIKHGKNVEIPEGTPLMAYVDQDVALPPLK